MEFLNQLKRLRESLGKENMMSYLDRYVGTEIHRFLELIDIDHCLIQRKKMRSHRIRFCSPYIAARVIGKNGIVIKTIRKLSSTEIISPVCPSHQINPEAFTYKDSFVLIAYDEHQINYARLLIITAGIYFLKKFNSSITPKFGEICTQINVQPDLVPQLLNKRASRIKLIQWITSVRIVSPKPYSRPCIFYLIGNENDVPFAERLFLDHVEQILN
ncbi:hypothetical protein SSS_07635 [Sarcoptes scabiei]|uniref:KH domain-containing protein n=1 Tax=Sarcoptes scabiei TaxID=52283 RepID=A0A834RE08_SARSC|nr:hypothetical protein SSS_07635 [Sarcoptes scabiei]